MLFKYTQSVDVIKKSTQQMSIKAIPQTLMLRSNNKAALKLIEDTLMDHLIITDEGYNSFSDEGML